VQHPTLATAFCTVANLACDTALRWDPGTRYALAKLDGTVIELKLLALDLEIFLCVENQYLNFKAVHDTEQTADVRLQGRAQDFVSLLFKGSKTFAGSDVRVEGNLHSLEQLRDIVSTLDIDWQSALAEALGPAPGQLIASQLESIFNFSRSATRDFRQRIKPFLTDELRVLIDKEEFRIHQDACDELRSRGDRIEQRIETLKKRNATGK
jgi:ubiquinone biosynthesis protein UbiJ